MHDDKMTMSAEEKIKTSQKLMLLAFIAVYFYARFVKTMRQITSWSLILVACLFGCAAPSGRADAQKEKLAPAQDDLKYSAEKHFGNLRQLTFGGDNAEAYWSFGNDQLVFQANNPNWGTGCDQIFVLELDEEFTPSSTPPKQISNGLGRTTCAYFMPGDSSVV